MKKNRPNPRGMTRDDEGSQIEKIGDGRYLAAWADTGPVREEDGEVVKDWSAVHMVWNSSLALNANVIYARVRPWRFFSTFPQDVAAGVREGAWVPDFEVQVALSAGAVTTQRSGSYCWETRGAEKMTWEIIEIVNLEQIALAWTQEQLYGYIREDDDAHVVAVTSPNAGDGGTTPPDPEPGGAGALPLAQEDTLYSNEWGDFVVTRSDINTLLLSDLDIPVREEQIYAVGRKVIGAVTGTTMYFRDNGTLDVDYNPLTGALDVDNVAFGATDIILVYLEGAPKTYNAAANARRVQTVNPDNLFNATDSELLPTQTFGVGAADDYFPFTMSEDGYHFLTAYILLTLDVVVTLEATNDVETDALATWSDITSDVFGTPTFTLNNPGMYNPVSQISYRRCRWRVQPGAAGGDATIEQTRTAYGSPRVQHVTHSEAVSDLGVPIMAEARSVQATAVAAAEATRFMANLYGELVNSNFTWATQSGRDEEINPNNDKHVWDVAVDDQTVNDGTYTAPTITSAPSDNGIIMDGYKDITFQLRLVGGAGAAGAPATVTVTFEAYIELAIAGVAQWVDITPAGYDLTTDSTGNASYIDAAAGATDYIVAFDNLVCRRIRARFTWDIDPDTTDGEITINYRRKAL